MPLSATAGTLPAGAQPKILIVEDDRFLIKILLAKFQKEGFETRAALEGEAALRELESFSPSVILLDIIMPKLNGFELLAILKANPKYADIPVVVLSNLSQEEDTRRAKDLGAADFFVKADVSINEVASRVREVIAKQLAKRPHRS